jgi:hypothetical protein
MVFVSNTFLRYCNIEEVRQAILNFNNRFRTPTTSDAGLQQDAAIMNQLTSLQ